MKMLFNMECYKCSSKEVVKNGFVRGKQRYLCKSCNRNFFEQAELSKNHLKRLVIHLYLEGMTRREVVQYLFEVIDEKVVLNWIDKVDRDTRSYKKEKSPEIFQFSEFGDIEEFINRIKPKLRDGFILIGIDKNYQGSYFVIPSLTNDPNN